MKYEQKHSPHKLFLSKFEFFLIQLLIFEHITISISKLSDETITKIYNFFIDDFYYYSYNDKYSIEDIIFEKLSHMIRCDEICISE